MVSAVARYFFTVRDSEGDILADPEGTLLPDLQAARLHAERIIKRVRRESGYDDPSLIMQVEDEAHRTVLFLRSCPGEWCSSSEAVVMSGKAGLIKLSRRQAA
jgi:hypothetical protein